jgi:hypothetical protein
VERAALAEPHRPALVRTRPHGDELDAVDRSHPGRLPHRTLGSLHGERVPGTAAIAVQPDLACLVGVEKRAHVLVFDSSVVEPLGQADHVARKAVAADVRRLPDPSRVRLPAEAIVERSAELRAAAIALTVRADDVERMFDRYPRRVAAPEGPDEVEGGQVVVPLELELEEALFARPRATEVDEAPTLTAKLRLLHEQETRVRQLAELVPEMSLEALGKEAAAEDVPVPEPAVFDEDPVIDAARGRSERLLAGVRDFGAEGLTDGHGHSQSLPAL